MDLIQLRYFCVAARYEHITQAAEELHITQPALSKVIARLEADLGTRLFDREGKRIRLNASGQIVLRCAGEVFSKLEDMQTELGDLASGVTGRIALVSSFPSREPNWVHRAIEEFMLGHPGVSLSMSQRSSGQILEDLETRAADIAIASSPVISPGIDWRELFNEPMGVILAADHPLAGRPVISLADLEREKFLCNNANSDVQDLTYIFCRMAGFEPNIYFEGEFPGFIGRAVSRGIGVSLISEGGYRRSTGGRSQESWEERIVYRPLAEAYCRRVCGLATQRDRYMPKAVALFYEALLRAYIQ